jgi:hypothetical protein
MKRSYRLITLALPAMAALPRSEILGRGPVLHYDA